MMYFLASIFDIGVSITQAIRSFGGLIASTIYNFIISIYNIFEILARADFLDSSFVNQIYTKAGLILGLFMVFKLSFVLVQSLISPEKLNDKKNGIGSIILRVVISIVLLGITPTIFKEAFRLQNLLIGTNNSDNIVYKLIVGQNISNKNNFGTELAKNIFFEFYSDEMSPIYNGGITMSSSIQTSTDGTVDTGTYIKANNFDSIVDDVSRNESFSSTPYYLALTDAYGDYYIEFDFLGSCIVGVVIAWILLSFCIQIAIRVFKLAFLQLIAPIPVLSYISDPEGSFKKWIQQCGATFIDLFIRLMIIYFVIFFSKDILNQVDSGIGYLLNSSDSTWVKVFLIIGLLMFAKRVPELLKDIFPSSGKFDLGIKSPKKLLDEIPGKGLATMGAGFAAGGIAGAFSGFRNGEGLSKIPAFFGGALRGAFGSAKTKGNVIKNVGSGLNNVRAANQRAYQRHHDGSTFFGRMAPVHSQRVVDEYERELAFNDKYEQARKAVDEAVNASDNVLNAQSYLESLTAPDRENFTRRDVNGTQIAFDQAGFDAANQAYRNQIADARRLVTEAKANALLYGETQRIRTALLNQRAIAEEGHRLGYDGFSGNTIITGDATNARIVGAIDPTSGRLTGAYRDENDNVRDAANNIRGASGDRNDRYRRAQANSKYGRNKK